MSVSTTYELVIGLEVHIQLATESKLFAADSTAFGSEPNSNISVITLAHPGIMPKLNKKAVEYAIRMGLACNSKISRHCIFDRKNYFYPDLPKGWQTTQDRTPICLGGEIEVTTNHGKHKAILNRIHLEEDAGKSIHDDNSNDSLIDLNRAGVALIELVTEPCLHSSESAMAILSEIRQMVRYLLISDGNMEQGSLRCDANISVRKIGDQMLGKKVEVKNMNSIRNVGKAIDYEFGRQVSLLEKKEEIVSETRLYDADKGTTSGMRTKEELNDYRYFPEPDISPFEVSDEWLKEIKQKMPATPAQMREKFNATYGLSDYDAQVISQEQEMALFFDQVCNETPHYKAVANWMMGPIKSLMNDSVENFVPVKVDQLVDLVELVESGKMSFSVANKELLPKLVNNPQASVPELAETMVIASDDHELSEVIFEVLDAHPDKVKAFKNGKKGLIGMFMGEVMKKMNGKADPKKMNDLLQQTLNNLN